MQKTYCFWWYDCWYASNKTLNPIVTELFIRGRKLNILLDFIIQSYFAIFYYRLFYT